jgi:predicted cupin superfamily sugar epimerase
MDNDAAHWIEKLRLIKHVEGGYYREIYRSPITVDKNNLPDNFNGNRNVCTAIYFLLEKEQFSAFHRIASDEIWHFYYGDTLSIYEIETNGTLIEHKLGSNAGSVEVFQTVIKAGNWFASRVSNGNGYALVGCTVSPGFDFEDFEMAERKLLTAQYPQHADLIKSLTKE